MAITSSLPPIQAAERAARRILENAAADVALPPPDVEQRHGDRREALLREAGMIVARRRRLLSSLTHFAGDLLDDGLSISVDRAHRVAVAGCNREIEALMVLRACEYVHSGRDWIGFAQHEAAYAGRDILPPGLLHQLRRPVPGHALDTWQKLMAQIATYHPMTWVPHWWQWEPKDGSFD